MNIVGIIIVYILILIFAGFLVSKYLDIRDKKIKKIINIVFISLTIVSIILMIIFSIYFFNLIASMGTVF